MSYTYCGKHCENCVQKIQLECPGCRTGPGKAYAAECAIARCCVARGHHDCDSCVNASTCFHLKGCGSAAELRLKKRQNDAAVLRGRLERSTVLGIWMTVAFWVLIASIAVGFLLAFSEGSLGDIVSVLFSIAYAAILLKMGDTSRCFRLAGILGIVCGVCNFLGTLSEELGYTALFSLVAMVLGFVWEYQEFLGYAEVTEELDPELSQKWRTLWGWQFGCLCAVAIGAVLTFIGLLLAALVVLVAAVASLVISVIKLFYIYRSAKLFQEYAQQNKYFV